MDMNSILVLAGGSFAAYLAAKTVVKIDTRIEDRRRRAATAAAWCAQNGLPGLSNLLSEYSIGNKSGVLWQAQQLFAMLGSVDELKNSLDLFLRTQLDKKLSSTDGKNELIEYVERKLGVTIDRAAITKVPVALTPDAGAKPGV